MKKDSILLKYLGISIITGLVVIGGYVSANYSDPEDIPTKSNTDEPIDISSKAQFKQGRLVIGTSDLSSLLGYVFSSLSGLSYIQRVVTDTLTLKDDSESDGYILTAVDDGGLATWKPEPASSEVASSKMYVHDFKMYVRRNAGTVTVPIPSDFDYCAISQMGPDFANSGSERDGKSTCAVNQVSPPSSKKWTMTGERGNDPSFWCNARCFSLNKPIVVEEEEIATVPSVRYYCLREDLTFPGRHEYDGDYFGCSTLSDFDIPGTLSNTMYSEYINFDDSGPIDRWVINSRNEFINVACEGRGATLDLARGDPDGRFFATGFTCR
jgi:hypothetical protein